MFAHALSTFGRVDALLNVAGTLLNLQPEVTIEEYDDMTAVNLRGVLLCCKHGVKAMVAGGGGAIVNVTSVGALNAEESRRSVLGGQGRSPFRYKVFRIQYGPQGIRVNALASGFAKDGEDASRTTGSLRYMNEKAALGRAAEPREHAEVAAFLASDRASFITGFRDTRRRRLVGPSRLVSRQPWRCKPFVQQLTRLGLTDLRPTRRLATTVLRRKPQPASSTADPSTHSRKTTALKSSYVGIEHVG